MTDPQTHPQAEYYDHAGLYLKEIREYYRLNVAEVAQRLHIRHKYIEAIESGQFSQLPPPVYARGYLTHYAEFLGVDPSGILTSYDAAMGQAPAKETIPVAPTLQAGLPNRRWLVPFVILLSCLVIGYSLLPETEEAPNIISSSVEELPENLRNRLAVQVLLEQRMPDCANHRAAVVYPPCYADAVIKRAEPFTARLPESILRMAP